MQTIVFSDARAKGETFYFTGKPCGRGHIAQRYVKGRNCVACMSFKYERQLLAIPIRRISRQARRAAANAGAIVFVTGIPCKRGHVAPRRIVGGSCVECERFTHVAAARAGYRAPSLFTESGKQKKRDLTKRWSRRYPERVREHGRGKIARKLRAIPKWANKESMRAIYKRAAEMTTSENRPYHVDHVVPLKSRLVCGLHCEANLQILPAVDNMKKRNLVWPDMPTQSLRK